MQSKTHKRGSTPSGVRCTRDVLTILAYPFRTDSKVLWTMGCEHGDPHILRRRIGIAAANGATSSRSRRATGNSRAGSACQLLRLPALVPHDLPGFPPLHAALAEHLSQKQVAEIAATVIDMNLWTRLKLAQGAIPVAERANPS